MINDFGHMVHEKLLLKLRGSIRFECYSDIDTIIFKVRYKEFNFSYAINNIQGLMGMYEDSVDRTVDAILRE